MGRENRDPSDPIPVGDPTKDLENSSEERQKEYEESIAESDEPLTSGERDDEEVNPLAEGEEYEGDADEDDQDDADDEDEEDDDEEKEEAI